MKRLLTLALLMVALPAAAAMYKWVDKDGKVHYSDQPPPDGAKQSGVVNAPMPSTSAPASAAPAPEASAATKGPKTAAEQEMEFRKRRLEAAEADAKRQQDAQAAEEKKRNCTQATSRVTALQTGGRITKHGSNGETVYLSDGEIDRELVEARKIADSWCK
jgi:type IV secretory pathway VirB10-like protein